MYLYPLNLQGLSVVPKERAWHPLFVDCDHNATFFTMPSCMGNDLSAYKIEIDDHIILETLDLKKAIERWNNYVPPVQKAFS